jgi:hypothetical protein
MNVEIGAEAPVFLLWEYLLRNFGILSLQCGTGRVWYCEGRKELAYMIVRLQLILFSEETGAFYFPTLFDFSTYLLHRFTASLAP